MVLTKREGLLLAAVLIGAALLTSAREWRATWPALGVVAAIVVVVAAPWRIWYIAHGVEARARPAAVSIRPRTPLGCGRPCGWLWMSCSPASTGA